MINNKPDTSEIENLLNEHYEETFKTRKTKSNKNKPQIINGSYNFIVRYKNDNEIELKHFFANDLKDLFESIERWKNTFCIYQDEIIEIKQIMEVA